MIKEYRKKVTIKAERFTGSGKQMNDYHICFDYGKGHHHEIKKYYLPTKEGQMVFHKGDWIATGIDGEHWAIADDIFRRTYEEINSNDD